MGHRRPGAAFLKRFLTRMARQAALANQRELSLARLVA